MIEQKFSKYMMAITAFHVLGDISRDDFELCHVYAEDEDSYYGAWVEGMGFFDVRFPKATIRELTPSEINEYSKKYVSISGGPAVKLFE